ncbi:MAG: internal scaffolding protein [Microvirus sp.]|nr:MAG: internal scaffolding protein [Microvirus sp.]
MFIRTPYNYDADEASLASGLACLDASMTQQQFKDECDINVIVRMFGITGELPQNVRMPTYGDFSAVVDYHTAMNAIRASQEAFEALPGAVRERFANDPQRFVDFCSDDRNLDEARKLGLVPATAPLDLNQPVEPPKPTPM